MKTGIELIAAERQEQIEKHGYDEFHDSEHNSGQLKKAAIYLLTGHKHYFPKWDHKYYTKFKSKIKKAMYSRASEIELLTATAALLSAEIDRLLTIEENENQ